MSMQVSPGFTVSYLFREVLLAKEELGTDKSDFAEGHKEETRGRGRMEGTDQQVYLRLKATQHGFEEGEC